MAPELLHALCALAAVVVPMGVAWAVVRWSTRHARRRRAGTGAPPRRPMR